MMRKSVRVAAVQMESRIGDADANFEKAEKFCKKAAREGAELICLPEMFDVGYHLNEIKKHPPKNPHRTKEFLSQLSRETGAYIIAGCLEQTRSKMYNCARVVSPQKGEIAKYRKVHLVETEPLFEPKVFTRGNQRVLVKLPFARVGVMICYDVRFPEMARSLCFDGAEILSVSSAFPFPRLNAWQIFCRARAMENQFFCIAANQVGYAGKTRFLGHSMIIAPDSTLLAEADDTHEKILIADLDAKIMLNYRKNIPTFKHLFPKVYRTLDD